MSLPEVLLWEEVRGSKAGAKFRRQHPIGPYVADFCCVALRLVIEIDGEAHDRSDRPDFDDTRDQWMRGQGYTVIRFSARDILSNLDGAVLAIGDAVATPLHHPSDGPPPRSGEEF